MESQIIHGSCFEVLPELPTGCVKAVFIDPPYNIGFDYGSGKQEDSLPHEVYLAQMLRLFTESVRCLDDTGSLWVMSPEYLADDFGAMLYDLLPRRNRIIWRETFGQYHERRYPGGHRHIFWHVKDPKLTPFYTNEIRVTSQRMLNGDKRAAGPRVPDDVWEFPRLVGNAAERIGSHPCQLPEALLRRIVLSCTSKGDLVMDPMSGSGSTARVAQIEGRRFLAIEKNPRFIDIIESRLSRAYQPSLFS